MTSMTDMTIVIAIEEETKMTIIMMTEMINMITEFAQKIGTTQEIEDMILETEMIEGIRISIHIIAKEVAQEVQEEEVVLDHLEDSRVMQVVMAQAMSVALK